MTPYPKPEPRKKKKPKGLKQGFTDRQKVKVDQNQEFYDKFIRNHPTGLCYECDYRIKNPTGKNVCHLWSSASAPREAYLDDENAVLACWMPCHWDYEFSTGKTPKITAIAEEIIPKLKLKYKGRK